MAKPALLVVVVVPEVPAVCVVVLGVIVTGLAPRTVPVAVMARYISVLGTVRRAPQLPDVVVEMGVPPTETEVPVISKAKVVKVVVLTMVPSAYAVPRLPTGIRSSRRAAAEASVVDVTLPSVRVVPEICR